jgi:hypothetical protein
MVRLVQDVDSWRGECTARPEQVYPDGTRFTVDCSLPAGHTGDHDDGNQPLPGRRVTGDVRDLADAVEQISHHFAWTAPDVDRDLTGAPGTIANSRDALANLADSPGHHRLPRRPTRCRGAQRRTPYRWPEGGGRHAHFRPAP